MQIVAFLFFIAVLGLALGSIASMLIGNADRILSALSGNGMGMGRSVSFVTFGDIKLSPSPANDALSLPLAA